ncbi:Uu.00g089310.m01.CDS01 [Anthostomella pinea]|uniref:Uu.00g089310.m01.CDS01 n=1 Tax=Anthostomella pinea TaxID=933095 RepID=A0AAI8VMP9_9PEZI|nr:Uu.00g089310.m01.CDS01 [Anthostomella pinea]
MLSYRVITVFVLAILILAGLFTSGSVDSQWRRLAHTAKSTGAVARGMPLRIMFLGASITRGEVSTSSVGYRKQLRDQLTYLGNPVNCVGFNRFGDDFDDNDVEGYGANCVRQTHEHAAQAVPALLPNLVLVQTGTSDCFRNDDPSNVGTRMRDLINLLLEDSPQATVILSTLVTTPNVDIEPCILSANAQFRQVAADFIHEGKRVALAEMHYDQGLPNRPLPADIGGDQIHPTDKGYFMMGVIFMEKIREVDALGYLKKPVDIGIPNDGNEGREEEDRLRELAQAKHPIDV